MSAFTPVGDVVTTRWRIFTDYASALAAYEALITAYGSDAEPLLPVRTPHTTDGVTLRAHPTTGEWALAYDALGEARVSPAGLVDTLPAGWDAARTHPDVIVACFGQSNALGSNNFPAATSAWTDDRFGLRWRFWSEDSGSYFAGQGTASSSGTVGGGLVPMTTFTAGATRFSPALALSRYLAVGGFGVAGSLVGQGSTNLASAWNASNPGAANLYQVFRGELEAAITQILAAGLVDATNYRLVGLWVQGEADAASALNSGDPSGDTYRDNLLDLFDTFAADFAEHTPSMLVAQLNDASTQTFKDAVRVGQTNAAAARPGITLIDPGAIPLGVGDGLHYNPANHQAVMRIAAGALATQLTS